MTETSRCRHIGHDMRHMPSMRAMVCRRCSYFEPIPEDDDAPRPRATVNWILFLWAVVLAAALFALWL